MEPEGSNADYGDRMEAGSGLDLCLCEWFYAVSRLSSDDQGGKRERVCVLDTWVMTRLEPREQEGWRKAEGKMNKRGRYYIYTLGGGTSMACTHETHQNLKRHRRGRGKRKRREDRCRG